MLVRMFFQDIEEFYNHKPERRYSEEADYGVHWRLSNNADRFRVSYIRATGEIYQVQSGGTGAVILLGTFPVDQEAGPGERYYSGLDKHLGDSEPDGWAHQCGKPNSLSWLLNRLETLPARRIMS